MENLNNQPQKALVMTQSQLKDFEVKCLDHLPHREAKRIITYLAQYIREDNPEATKEEKKPNP